MFTKKTSQLRTNRRLQRLRQSVFRDARNVPVDASEARVNLARELADLEGEEADGAGVAGELESVRVDFADDDVDVDYFPCHDSAEEDDDDPGNDRQVGHESEPTSGNDVKPRSMEDVSVFFASMQARREIPITVMSDNANLFARSLDSGEIPTFRQMRYHSLKTVPNVLMDVACTRRDDGRKVNFLGKSSYPRKVIAEEGLRRDYVLYYASLQDVIKLHKELHPSGPAPTEFDFSVDGIPETKSSGLSIDVLSIRMTTCRTVYTLAVLQPARKAMQLPDSIVLEHFLDEYRGCGLRVRYAIADAPKRSALQGMKQHSANYGCPYCKAKKINKHYPSETAGAPLRNDVELRALAEIAHEEDEDVLCGVKQPSPIRSIDIDLVHNVPAEKMHLLDLGIVRKIMQLSFRCTAFKATDVPFMRSSDVALSEKLTTILCLPEFARRTRPLDLANYKAEEYRNLATCFWPAVADTIPPAVVDLWLLTVFLVRGMILPDENYQELQEFYDLTAVLKRWYIMFESVFTVRHCSHNVHVFGAHFLLVRELGPITETSAYCYEGHYNVLKRSYRAGTPSTGQQALKNSLLATKYHHKCVRRRRLTAKKTQRTDDTYCYLVDGSIVRATADETDGFFVGHLVPVQPAFYALRGYDFNRVLAFKMQVSDPDPIERTYRFADVVAKCIRVGDVLSAMPWSTLHDS